MLIGVGALCHILYCIVSYLYVSFSGLITSIGDEKVIFFCYRLVNCIAIIMWFLFGGVSSSSRFSAWDRLRYFKMALPGHSI